MSELSPSARAVLDAAYEELDYVPRRHVRWAAAAALRAATDLVVPEQQIPRGHLVNLGGDTIEVFPQSARIPIQKLRLLQEVRNNFLVIITELENHV